jgi:hypothetical protein
MKSRRSSDSINEFLIPENIRQTSTDDSASGNRNTGSRKPELRYSRIRADAAGPVRRHANSDPSSEPRSGTRTTWMLQCALAVTFEATERHQARARSDAPGAPRMMRST